MYRKILVPLDGSDLAECALAHARAIGTGCNVPEVILLRVMEPQISAAMGELAAANPQLATDIEQQSYTENKAQAKRYTDRMVDKLKKEGVAARSVIVEGKAAEGILDYAANNEIDMIIMSTHGRSGISRWAFGSVAERISRYSPVPVLIVSPQGCRAVSE